ncbi:MAG: PAS domain S-box protein [Verrucomicrobiota bacterium]|nr:PAS domain S-box protein [Limisphaera sp.]MDW8382653.1 PAS domain S-box protein [Verrucomicrobiota bacterium]
MLYRTESPIKPAPEEVCRWWQVAFDAAEHAQAVCGRDGRLVQFNRRAAHLFQVPPRTPPEILTVWNWIAPPADAKLRQVLLQEPPRAEILHSVISLREGRPHLPIDLESLPLQGGYFLLTFKDVSRRLRLESHIQRLITAIDATPDAFFLADADLRITFVNPAFQTLTGYSMEEVLGRPDAFLRAPFEQEKVQAYLDAVTQGQEWIGELVNIRRDGCAYHVEATISPIADMAGRFMGYVACERDITLRIQLQEQLRIQRDFIHSILQSLDGAIYSLDCEFRLTHANEGWRHLPVEHAGFRINAPPTLGRNLLEYVPDPGRRAELERVFREVLEHCRPVDNRYQGPDGRHWLLKVSPWVDGAQVRGLICSVTDQTHYHELQQQLFQAQKMEIIGTLAAGVAHDFNNLLQAIRGNCGLLLRETSTDSRLRREIEQIDLAAARAADITQQLLSFSRESRDNCAVLDLNQLVQEALILVRRTLRGNVTLETRIAAEPLPVRIDSTRASQAILNLCVNAQDAMPNGGRITLETEHIRIQAEQAQRHNLPPGTPYARCTVRDTGTGIPPDLIPRIFAPFFTTKARGKGTGLGLPIVQRITEEAGGFIEVESVLGQGSAFHLFFPLCADAPAPLPQRAAIQLAQGRGRVLVVDDLDLLRDFTRSFLEAAGLEVLVAESGPEAIRILESAESPVDLLFTDYSMPGMNGLELVEAVLQRWPHMRCVLASGYLDGSLRARLAQLNVSVLAKPYDMREASELITRKLAEPIQSGHSPAIAMSRNG